LLKVTDPGGKVGHSPPITIVSLCFTLYLQFCSQFFFFPPPHPRKNKKKKGCGFFGGSFFFYKLKKVFNFKIF